MDIQCDLSTPWIGTDFIPCYRGIVINGLIPAVVAISSFILLIKSCRQYYKSRSTAYSPLIKNDLPIPNQYGSISPNGSTKDDIDNDLSGVDIMSSRWTIFNCSRLIISLVQFTLYMAAVIQLYNDHYKYSEYEGTRSDLLIAYSTHALYWGYSLLLSGAVIYLSDHFNLSSNTICSTLNLLYIVSFIVGMVNLRSYYLINYTHTIETGYLLSIVSTALILILITILTTESRLTPVHPVITEEGRILSSEKWVSLYSKYTFSWIGDLMKKGHKGTLDDKDLIELPSRSLTKNTLKNYQSLKSARILPSFYKTFRGLLFYQFIYNLISNTFIFGPPYCLNRIVKYIEDPQGAPSSTAYLYVLGLFLSGCIQSIFFQQSLYIGRVMGIRTQSILIGEVFSKSLRRRDTSGATDSDSGETKKNVNNLLSVDSQKISEVAAYLSFVYGFPIQIIGSMWGLYKLLGNAALWGILVMILCQPFTYVLGKRFERIQGEVMTTTDQRLKLVNELLSAIRIVKFFAWEDEFRKRIMQSRDTELSAIRSRLFMFMWIINAWFIIPIAIMVTVFYVYTQNNSLTASVAFTAIALFYTFRAALDEFPMLIASVLQANVSIKRIEHFLNEEEVSSDDQSAQYSNSSSTMIGFTNDASFSWEKPSDNTDTKPTLRNLNISFPVGKLSIICGPTGSGKTTLLSSLLGETIRLSGNVLLPRIIPNIRSPLGGAVSGIAYVAQSAWLQNCSIRDNILFGLPYEESRYEDVLYMTALTRDLEILEFGDSTEIGEKGITLSGGQKQRVAIARAVYSQAHTVILDDCLSAVDAHTAKHLYDNCITGPLMNDRTIILVTHHVSLCLGNAAYVVVLKDGEVMDQGPPLKVLNSGALGEELANSEELKISVLEEEAAEGSIPAVSRLTKKKSSDKIGGKLVQEEDRAEGSVSLSVYKTYITASGGFLPWFLVIIFFCASQGLVVGQDYWIKVWSAAYNTNSTIPHSASIASLPLNAFSHNIMNTVYTQPIQNAFKSLQSPDDSIDVTYYLGVYFLIGLVAVVMTTLRSYTLFTSSLKASRELHSRLLNRILRAKVRFFDTTPLGRIVNRFSSDMSSIDQDQAFSFAFILQSIISTLFVTILISGVIPIFLIPGVVIGYSFWKIGLYYLETSRDLKRLNSVSRSPIYVQFNESMNGVSTIRAFGCQHRFIQDNHGKIDSNNRPFLWMWVTNRWVHTRIEILGAFVGFCTGLTLILSRSWIDPGLAGLTLSYALTFTHNVLWVIRHYASNEMNMNAIERVEKYLEIEEEPPAEIPETHPGSHWPESGQVEVNNLVMQYTHDSPAVIRDVTFKIMPREKVGIVGRTGSGKSTLALSLFRFMEPTSGTILIDGVDIHKIGLNVLRSRLTIIPQDPVLFSGTLRSNLDPFDQYNDIELWAALKRSHLIDEENNNNDISLDSPVSENGSNWSQGQRQLISLARALVKKSTLIILDEATSSVDFDTDHRIQTTIRTEFKDSALLCIAHRIRTVADYDRILVLDHGELVEFDTPYELMTREGGTFQQMCLRSGEYNELLEIARNGRQ
ncbi:P-loop containing nucleoside triphosphate hydrolase protein [Pilobolus umbonatus]|nr:P-loop containing nucleoside triphosphate hydrolase protein [Pilobolus umbonatus]